MYKRNRRIISHFLAMVVFFATIGAAFTGAVAGVAPVFADVLVRSGEEEGRGGEQLKRYGFISGGDNGDLMLDSYLTREQLAIIICSLYGKNIEGARFKRPPNYTDAYKFPTWSRSYISYCQYMGWMHGRSNGIFDNTGKVSSDELATVIVRVLGYTVEDYRESVATLEQLGITVPRSYELTRGEAFDVLWKTVTRPIMKNGKSLGEVTGRLKSEPSAFRITNLRSNNLGYLVAEFSKAVDPISVGKGSIELVNTQSGEAVEISSVKVVQNMVYFIPPKPFTRMQAACSIRGVNSNWSESDVMPEFSKAIRIDDSSNPNFVGFEISGERSITLIFDEPISKVGNVRLKVGNVYISVENTGVVGLMTDRLTFAVHSNLQEGKVYSVEAQYFKDLVGKNNNVATREAVFVRSSQEPTLQLGEQKTDFIEVIFSTPVNGIDETKFYHTSPEKHPIKITAVADFRANATSRSDYVDRIYLWFYDPSSDKNYPVPVKETPFFVDEKGITDGFGRPLKAGNYTVRASDEVVIPKVQHVTFKSPRTLLIGFTSVVTMPKVEVRTSDGQKLRLSPVGKGPADTYEFRFASPVQADTIKVEIADARDNKFSDLAVDVHKVDIRIDDEIPPTLLKAEKKAERGEYFLILTFSEPIDDTGLQMSSYQLVVGKQARSFSGIATFALKQGSDSQNADSDGEVQKDWDKRIVLVKLPESDYKELLEPAKEIYVTGVKDLAGNVIKSVRKSFEEKK